MHSTGNCVTGSTVQKFSVTVETSKYGKGLNYTVYVRIVSNSTHQRKSATLIHKLFNVVLMFTKQHFRSL